MPKPEHHIFVCVQRRPEGHPRGCCASKGGGEAVFNAIAQELIKRNLQNKVAITSTGCLGPCQAGGNVLIYPGGYMYSWVAPGDAAEIVEKHIVESEVVEERLAPAELW